MDLEKRDLLRSDEAWTAPESLYSCWSARGLYSPLQFVLRLRPDIHKALNSAPAGLVKQKDLSDEQISAFSTYLHETIHWWQHVGSTSGLLLSLLYPAQAHMAHDDLIKLLELVGPRKSLRDLNSSPERNAALSPEARTRINVALNNWHDIEFCKWLMLDPVAFGRRSQDRYFESVGHSYSVAFGAVMSIVGATIDPKFEFLPHPSSWGAMDADLRNRRVPNFFYGSDLHLPSIGASEIFEGQARLSQMQYLANASRRKLTWSEFQAKGMLEGVYGKAFERFRQITGLTIPEELDAPPFGLFLLLCDIALNPVEGLIRDLSDSCRVVETIDPGWRFLRLCVAVRSSPQEFSTAVEHYSKEEYFQTSDQLCRLVDFLSPMDLSERVTQWSREQPKIVDLLNEDRTFEFRQENLPVRVFVARFLRLQIDKAHYPQFFCWPGVSMTPDRASGLSSEIALTLFEEHRALFLDKEDGDVYPRTFKDRNAGAVDTVFNNFYSWVCTYDLTRQWLVASGPFVFDFAWLTSKYSDTEISQWASNHFKGVYGRAPSEYTALVARID